MAKENSGEVINCPSYLPSHILIKFIKQDKPFYLKDLESQGGAEATEGNIKNMLENIAADPKYSIDVPEYYSQPFKTLKGDYELIFWRKKNVAKETTEN
jgi:hypothetical protein